MDLEASSLLTNFHSARRRYMSYWGRDHHFTRAVSSENYSHDQPDKIGHNKGTTVT